MTDPTVITCHLAGIIALVALALRFRWRTTPTARDRLEAAARGYRVTGASWPFGTWTVRLACGFAAIYLVVSLAFAVSSALAAVR